MLKKYLTILLVATLAIAPVSYIKSGADWSSGDGNTSGGNGDGGNGGNGGSSNGSGGSSK